MPGSAKKWAKIVTVSLLTCGMMGSATIMAMPEIAAAKSEKAQKGGKKAKQRQSKKSKGQAKKVARSVQAPTAEAEAELGGGKKAYRGGNAIAVALGVHPSELGNLNAWNNNSVGDMGDGMPKRLAEFEAFVLWSAENEENQSLAETAAELFGDPACDPIVPTKCAYDLAELFPIAQPVEGDPDYEDFLAVLAGNDALELLAEQQLDGTEYGPEAELAALNDIANKEISDGLFSAIRDWILAKDDAQANAD